jgi:hypothetical protein
LSVYEVSIELAAVPELSSTWEAGPADVRQLTPATVFDSYSQSLFQELLQPGQADYAVVDLGDGRKWLTSRLFIFALVLGRVRGCGQSSLSKLPASLRPGAGKCPANMTEEFVLKQQVGNAAAVDGDKCRFCPRALIVDITSAQFLAGSGWPSDEHFRIG